MKLSQLSNGMTETDWNALPAGEIYQLNDRIVFMIDKTVNFEVRINRHWSSKERQSILCWAFYSGSYGDYSEIKLDTLMSELENRNSEMAEWLLFNLEMFT